MLSICVGLKTTTTCKKVSKEKILKVILHTRYLLKKVKQRLNETQGPFESYHARFAMPSSPEFVLLCRVWQRKASFPGGWSVFLANRRLLPGLLPSLCKQASSQRSERWEGGQRAGEREVCLDQRRWGF